MTKKHYEAIAGILEHAISDLDERMSKNNAMYRVAELLADYFESENKLFNREKFLNACGVEQECPHAKEYQQANEKGGWNVMCRHCNAKISEII